MSSAVHQRTPRSSEQVLNSNSSTDDEILTVSYRSKYHLYPHSKIIDRSHSKAGPYEPTYLEWALSFMVIHYFLWVIAMLGVLAAVWKSGHPYIAILLVALYLPSFFNNDQGKLGRPWHSLRMHPIWHSIQRYLQVEAVRLQKLDNKKQYMFATHPHGILILSRPAIYGGVFEALFPGIETRVLGASPMFYLPGCRELCLWMAAILASKHVAEKAVNTRVPQNDLNASGKLSLVVYPGGTKEIFTTDRDSHETVLHARKGFIRLAIENGLDLVPVFVFNEKYCYNKLLLPKSVQSFFLNVLRSPMLVFWGKAYSWVPLVPKTGLTVLFGKVIPVEQQKPAKQEYVDDIQHQYYEAMKELFTQHKDRLESYPADEKVVLKDEEARRGSPMKQKSI